MNDLKGQTALVTGASSGLGAAFARLLAARGANLVVTARREANLKTLADELTSAHGTKVTVIGLDLSQPYAAKVLFEKTEGSGIAVDILVNNAGFGTHQYFVDIPWDEAARQIQLNVVSLTEASHRFSRAMLARGRGHILNVSSIGAYTPTPSYATYAAGKAYVRDFTEALAYELAGTPVRVCCLCPGGTLTEFHQASGHELPSAMRATFMSAEKCARIGLSAMFRGRRNVVAGVPNKLGMFLLRFIPRRVIVWAAAFSMGKPKVRGELTAGGVSAVA
jgi:short-subunit dehydrogenase